MKSYDYDRRDQVRELTWDDFATFSKYLAERLAPENVDIIIGIARAGLLPATAVSCMLRKEMYPIRLTRRKDDVVVSERPIWKVTLPEIELGGRIIAVVDEIADTGETLSMVAEGARERGAKRIITACLISHTWAMPKPDIVILETDDLVLFPWSTRVYDKGEWRIHPEIEDPIRKLKRRT